MNAMLVSAGHVVVGTILHFAYAGFLGVLFAMIIAAAMMMRVPLMRTAGGVVTAGVIGGALLYVVMRWGPVRVDGADVLRVLPRAASAPGQPGVLVLDADRHDRRILHRLAGQHLADPRRDQGSHVTGTAAGQEPRRAAAWHPVFVSEKTLLHARGGGSGDDAA
jgi:hypothetical protein